MIDYIETSCIGKKSAELCEDAFFAGEHFAAVIDGSTSKASRTYHETMSNGKLASSTVRDVVRTLPFEADLKMTCSLLEKSISELYKKYDADTRDLIEHPENRITASVVIYSDFRKEIWMIGDCLCLVDGKLYTNEKPHEAALAEKRSKEIHRLLESGYSIEQLMEDDLGRKVILAGIIESTQGQNTIFSVVDGFSIPIQLVKVIKVADAKEIILASDGYPIVEPSLEKTEKTLFEIVKNDPLLINLHKATKGLRPGQTSFDDRTYLRMRVE